MGPLRAAAVVGLAVAVGAVALSGGEASDPRTPAGLWGKPAPFLGVAVVGSGGRTMAVDAYGNVVDLRAPGPAGEAIVAVDPERQAAGSVDPDEAIAARGRVGTKQVPLWLADSVRQRYLPGTNVMETAARFGQRTVVVVRRVGGLGAAAADRRWLARARPLGAAAPAWAVRMYERSLLVLRALTDRRSGAVAAGAREGWAYVWPRDAGAVALALAAAGFRHEAQRVARFLLHLDLEAAARFDGDGDPVAGRAAQGDAAGWVEAAARAARLETHEGPESGRAPSASVRPAPAWHDQADYQEGDPGGYLANAIASASGVPFSALRRKRNTGRAGTPLDDFVADSRLVRVAGEPDSGWDSAAAWGVRPFPNPALFPAIRRTLREAAASSGRFGILPSQNWHGGEDPWTAPTGWTAWSLAALARHARQAGAARVAGADRRAALSLMTALRRAATPLGLLPERVDAQSGLPRSTTPLTWSHAFAILALRQLWPGRASI